MAEPVPTETPTASSAAAAQGQRRWGLGAMPLAAGGSDGGTANGAGAGGSVTGDDEAAFLDHGDDMCRAPDQQLNALEFAASVASTAATLISRFTEFAVAWSCTCASRTACTMSAACRSGVV